MTSPPHSPPYDCPLCPRLAEFRHANRAHHPGFFNNPVPAFGSLESELLVVGLAPGLKGANQTGRPFTGDYAGVILYSALKRAGFAQGGYAPEALMGLPADTATPDRQTADGFTLHNARVTNAVRCVPPANKPEPGEIRSCNHFLKAELAAMPNVKVVVSLGLISHKAVLTACGFKQSAIPFKHGGESALPRFTLLSSYHCSRYNINTGVLTQSMFDAIIDRAGERIRKG